MKRKHSRRERLELAIEKAIALLDQIDGDPDLEPSLSSSTCVGAGGGINRLVSPDTAFFAQHFDGGSRWSQENWASGSRDDLEDEHDGREHHQQSWPNPMAENFIGRPS